MAKDGMTREELGNQEQQYQGHSLAKCLSAQGTSNGQPTAADGYIKQL